MTYTTPTDDWQNAVLTGDARETLYELPESSVHACVTSPPYFGLRDYGVDDQIGLEDSLDEFIDELVGIGRGVRHALRPDGSWWLNLGDSYATARSDHTGGEQVGGAPSDDYATRNEGTLGRKNKMLVPHRVAIALQADGWTVRNDVTWVKPNPMPSSVKDRLNTTTEQIFHLVPNPDYWYDLDAIREQYAEASAERYQYGYDSSDEYPSVGGISDKMEGNPAGKNPGDVFEVTTKPFPDAHFAVYPPDLVEKPIKATVPPKVCAECGAPYQRDVERERIERNPPEGTDRSEDAEGFNEATQRTPVTDGSKYAERLKNREVSFKGWTQTCACDTDNTDGGIVLDPFAGAGTTLLKAKELGRRFVGIELNPEYADLARARIGLDVADPTHVRGDDDQSGLEAFADADE